MMKNYRYFIRSFAFTGLCSLLALMAFNYVIDPNNRYHFKVTNSDLVRLSQDSKLVLAVPGNYDDRILLKRYIAVSAKPELAVVGGSRILDLQYPELGNRFLNAGITAGTIKDYIAIWQVIKQNQKMPQTIFLCVDFQALTRTSQNDRWLSLNSDYEAFFKRGPSGRYAFASFTTQLKDLLSLQTLRQSFASLGAKRSSARLIPLVNYRKNEPARASSFAFTYPMSYEQMDPGIVAQSARANGEGELKLFKNWNSTDYEYFNLLKMLITDMKEHHVRVALVLMPYHPLSLQIIVSDSTARSNFDSFRQELLLAAQQLEVPYYDGVSDTMTLRCTHDDFYDGVHLKSGPNREFFKRICKTFSWEEF